MNMQGLYPEITSWHQFCLIILSTGREYVQFILQPEMWK